MNNEEMVLNNTDSRSVRQRIEDLDGWFIKDIFLEAPVVKENIFNDLDIYATPTIRDITKTSPTVPQMKLVIKTWKEARYHSRSEEISYIPKNVDFAKVEEIVRKEMSEKGISESEVHVLRVIMDKKHELLDIYKDSLKFDSRAFYDWLDRNQGIIYSREV